MEKTYGYDSKRDAQKRWTVGKRTWIGDDRTQLWIVTAVQIGYNAGNSTWDATVTFRPATRSEFVAGRIAYLQGEQSKNLSVCSYSNPDPGTLELGARARVAEIRAEIAALEAEVEVAQ